MHYYRALAKAHAEFHRPLRLVMVHAEVQRAMGYVQSNQLADLTEYLVSLIGQLKAGGADFAAIPAATPHVCIDELLPRSPLPLVSLLDVVRQSISGKRIALFGTRFTIETDFFGALRGENTIRPQPSEVDQIHEAYVRTAIGGEGTEADRQALTALAHTLIQREQLEAVVFAGTDLALLFNPSNTTFPFIDCAQLHIDAIMKRLFP
ncbi:MAG: aspartate/glutamate racemase family protein [Candidatus Sulfotelmatobacter sp.]